MSLISLRRRRPLAGSALILTALLLIGLIYAVITNGATASASSPSLGQQKQISQGRAIFVEECASCHGLFAQGIPHVAPSLIGVGSAAVDFQVSTGRMPARYHAAEMPQGRPALNPQQIKALGTYVQSLGGGPMAPTKSMVSETGANPGIGQQLFVADCAQCHNFVGAGGALTYGKYAPPLTQATPTQIYEAMLTGPYAMPVFNNSTITPQQKRDIIAFVVQTRSEANPGGFSLGRIGPVTEGLVAFLGLLLFLVFAALWITAKHGKSHE